MSDIGAQMNLNVAEKAKANRRASDNIRHSIQQHFI